MITPPRVANNTDTEINKALIAYAGILDGIDETIRKDYATADAAIVSRVVALESNLDILARSYKAGGAISYAGVADTHTVQPMALGVWYQGTAPGAVMRRYLVTIPQTTITNAFANYPAAGAWAYVTVDYLGTLQLRAATGALTARPTDNLFQLAGGGVGYDDIDRFGYYYADGERVVGAIGRVSATVFLYIVNGQEEEEKGQYLVRLLFSVTAGNQTYTMQDGHYTRGKCRVGHTWGWVRISAKDAAAAGNARVMLPFVVVGQSSGSSLPYSEGLTLAAGKTWVGGYVTSNVFVPVQFGSGVASQEFAVGAVAANCNIMWDATFAY